MIGELESIWKEAFVAFSRCYTEIFLVGLCKAMKDLVEDIRRPDRDSNGVPVPDIIPECYQYINLLGLCISNS
jgi:hypothetical protein